MLQQESQRSGKVMTGGAVQDAAMKPGLGPVGECALIHDDFGLLLIELGVGVCSMIEQRLDQSRILGESAIQTAEIGNKGEDDRRRIESIVLLPRLPAQPVPEICQ